MKETLSGRTNGHCVQQWSLTRPGLKLESYRHLIICQAYRNAEARCTDRGLNDCGPPQYCLQLQLCESNMHMISTLIKAVQEASECSWYLEPIPACVHWLQGDITV